MSHQTSFDFALDDIPARVARPRRKRTAPPPPVSVPLQLSLDTCSAAVDAPARTLPRPRPQARLPVIDPLSALPAPPEDERRWCQGLWTARVVRSDDTWAVEMLREGEAEAVLVEPWGMAPDGRNPRPLDQAAFDALLKMSAQMLQRHERQRHAGLHRRLTVAAAGGQWALTLDIVPDEYEPHALLAAFDQNGERLAQERVAADFTLTAATARAWIEGDFRRAEAS